MSSRGAKSRRFSERMRESGKTVTAMKRRDRIGNPGLRAVKRERGRLGIPDGIWVSHHPPIFGTSITANVGHPYCKVVVGHLSRANENSFL